MDYFSNFFEFIRLLLLLVLGGTVFKVCISVIEGKKIEVNPLNPLNLKARWPREKMKENKDSVEEN